MAIMVFLLARCKGKGETSCELGLKHMWMRCDLFLEQHIAKIYPH